jgi:hypothetical protein
MIQLSVYEKNFGKKIITYEASEIKIRVKISAYRVKWIVEAETRELCEYFRM